MTTIGRFASIVDTIVFRGEVVFEEELLGVCADLNQRSRGYLKLSSEITHKRLWRYASNPSHRVCILLRTLHALQPSIDRYCFRPRQLDFLPSLLLLLPPIHWKRFRCHTGFVSIGDSTAVGVIAPGLVSLVTKSLESSWDWSRRGSADVGSSWGVYVLFSSTGENFADSCGVSDLSTMSNQKAIMK